MGTWRRDWMIVLEAVAPLVIGIAVVVFLILAFVGSSPNYPPSP